MTRNAYIFVPGVLSYPGSARNWTDRAVTWINNRMTCEVAEKFEYLALPITRNLLAARRAAELAELIDRYPVENFSLVLAGHSFGCELIRLALQQSRRAANFVHLFAPAVPSEPRRHRLKGLVTAGKIGFLNLYISNRDRVLTGHFLGGVAAEGVRAQFADEHHTTVRDRDFGHCGWFDGDFLIKSIRAVAGLAEWEDSGPDPSTQKNEVPT